LLAWFSPNHTTVVSFKKYIYVGESSNFIF